MKGAKSLIFSGSVRKRLQQAVQLARNPLQHVELSRTMHAARVGRVAANDRSIEWKYLGTYLAGGLTTRARLAAIITHYRILLQRLTDDGQRRAWGDGLTLWSSSGVDGRDYTIRLGPSPDWLMEGEVQLRLFRADKLLFALTFALIDGAAIEIEAGPVLFVGGLQGGTDCRAETRQAARDHGEVAPAAMLLLAAWAVADTLAVERIVVVPHDRQVEVQRGNRQVLFSYDSLSDASGWQRSTLGYLIAPRPGMPRARDHLSAAHRARARRKENRKLAMLAKMRDTVATHLSIERELAAE